MSTLRENNDYSPSPSRVDEIKTATLDWLLPTSIKQEVGEMYRKGYDISIGETDDRAYDNPSSIRDVYEALHDDGEIFQREMGRFDTGYYALLSTLRFGAPATPVRDWAKTRLNKRQAKAEELRTQLLYGRLDVQGAPWHEQGGKALALGTIVDASDLDTGIDGGKFKTMSGRLTEEIIDYKFDENAGWLSGLDLRTAIIATEAKFKNSDNDKSEAIADRELAQLAEFVSMLVRPGFKDIVEYCTDSLGIRSRKEEVRSEINRYVDQSDKDSFVMMSVGCGTALPMLEVIDDLRKKNKDAKLILLDQDPIALAAAEQFAEEMGLKDSLEIHCEQLFHGKGRSTHLIDLQTVLKGRELDVCEDSGLREYFPDFLYKDLTKQAWASLTDGGLMTTGNMNKNRPQAEFLHGLMGWPIPVQMRYISDIAQLHADAGIPKSASRLRVTQDGVYTLCFSSKDKTTTSN